MEWIKSIDEAIEIIDRKIDANKIMIDSYRLYVREERIKKERRESRIRDLENQKRLLQFANGDKNLYPTWI